MSAQNAKIGRSERKERTSSNLAHVAPSQDDRAPLFSRLARTVATSTSRTSMPSSSDEDSVLDIVGTLIIFFFMNRDDFRNQSNIRILIIRNRMRIFRCRRDSDSNRRIDSEEIVTGT